MLWSAILFIWELVGIDLQKAKEAGGNAGAIIGALKSPQAVPWALLILVGYFLFRTMVEWYQCNVGRRRLKISRIDYASVWLVASIAIGLYILQAVSHLQLANAIQDNDKLGSAGEGILVGLGFTLATFSFWSWRKQKRPLKDLNPIFYISFIIGLAGPLEVVTKYSSSGLGLHWPSALLGIIISATIVALVSRPLLRALDSNYPNELP